MSHYEKAYFDWQKELGEFGGKAEQFKFRPYIKPTDNVLDFGCGGGFVLKNLPCAGKMGIEINAVARENCAALGVKAVPNVSEVPDNWADVIISNHALEHTHQPLDEIKSLFPKLKSGGTILFCVPWEKINPWAPNDINQHLYTWAAMNLGNLFTLAGYNVQSVAEVKHKWPPHFFRIHKMFGQGGFDLSSKLYARYKWKVSQLLLVARKP